MSPWIRPVENCFGNLFYLSVPLGTFYLLYKIWGADWTIKNVQSGVVKRWGVLGDEDVVDPVSPDQAYPPSPSGDPALTQSETEPEFIIY